MNIIFTESKILLAKFIILSYINKDKTKKLHFNKLFNLKKPNKHKNCALLKIYRINVQNFSVYLYKTLSKIKSHITF